MDMWLQPSLPWQRRLMGALLLSKGGRACPEMAQGLACISKTLHERRGVQRFPVRTHMAPCERAETETPGEHLNEQPNEYLRGLYLRAVLQLKLKISLTWPQVIHCCGN